MRTTFEKNLITINIRFGTLSCGEKFIYFNELYIKTEEVELTDGTTCNAVCINDGYVDYFDYDTVVSNCVNPKLTISGD